MEVLQNNHRSNLFSATAREKLASEIMSVLSKNDDKTSDVQEESNSGVMSSIFEERQQKSNTFVDVLYLKIHILSLGISIIVNKNIVLSEPTNIPWTCVSLPGISESVNVYCEYDVSPAL